MTTNTTGTIEADMDESLAEARALGKEYGKSAGTWIEFADEDSARKCIQLNEDGDPAWDDKYGLTSPLSGQWADDLTPAQLLNELSLVDVSPEEEQDICEAFDFAFRVAYVDEVVEHAREFLGID